MVDTTALENKWYVVVAKTNYYKRMVALFEKLGVSYYLPVQRQLHYWSDRKKWINVYVLSPYLFLFTNELDRKLVFQSSGVLNFLKRDGKLTTVKEEEVEKIRLLCDYSSDLKIENDPVREGDLVEIIHGPFSGMKGYALHQNGRHRFLVRISGLGQFASVEIDSNCLKLS